MKFFDFNKISKAIGDVVNEGAKIAGDVTNTVVKVGGDVVNEGAKIAGDVTNTAVKVGGDVVNEGVKIAGDVTNTVVKVGGDVVNEGVKIAGDVTNTVVKVGGDVVNEGVKIAGDVTNTAVKVGGDVVNEGVKIAINVADTTFKTLNDIKLEVMKFIDLNGNGQIDIEDIIIMGLSLPHIQVNRGEFLQKEFMKRYSQEVVDEIITNNPAYARIPSEVIDEIANDVIQYERNCVYDVSMGMDNLFNLIGMLTSIIQYYGYMLRVIQKLMYLYGFPEIDVKIRDSKFEQKTLNTLIISLGVMFGVTGANYVMNRYADKVCGVLEKVTPINEIYSILVNISK